MSSQKTDTESKLLPMYGKIVLSLENILLPQHKLERSPSIVDGLDPDTEYDLRILGCELIQTAGILLKLPQVAMATGQVLFQRFYFCKSFVRHPMEITAMGCIYLASKIEEAPRRMRDVINVFHHIRQVRCQKEITPLIPDQLYWNVKSQVIKAERRILKELGFCVHVKHPHKLIVCYLQVLMLERNSSVLQMAWNYINDSLRTDVFLQHSPETVACACIYLTARKLKIVLPKNPTWFTLFNVKEDEIVEVCRKIVKLYKRQKIDPEALESKVEQLKKTYEEGREKVKVNIIVSGNNTPNSNKSEHKSPSPPPKIRKIELTPKKSPRKNSDPNSPRKRDRDSLDASPRKSPRKNRDRERDRERERERDRDKDRDSRSRKERDYRSSRRERDYKSSKKDRRSWMSPNYSKIKIS